MTQSNLKIVNYEPKYRTAFKQLNTAWIETHFKMEDSDHKALDNPETYILANGGAIIIALLDDEPVGVCALIKMDGVMHDFELAKMTVDNDHRGKGIGHLLGVAIIEEAKKLKAKSIYLESNSILKPALNLYKKLGFTDVEGVHSPYNRCDVQMELVLK